MVDFDAKNIHFVHILLTLPTVRISLRLSVWIALLRKKMRQRNQHYTVSLEYLQFWLKINYKLGNSETVI